MPGREGGAEGSCRKLLKGNNVKKHNLLGRIKRSAAQERRYSILHNSYHKSDSIQLPKSFSHKSSTWVAGAIWLSNKFDDAEECFA